MNRVMRGTQIVYFGNDSLLANSIYDSNVRGSKYGEGPHAGLPVVWIVGSTSAVVLHYEGNETTAVN